MEDHPEFAPACRALRDRIIDHYRERNEVLDDEAGLRTLDTNTTLVPQRARVLMDLARARGLTSLTGLDVADLGCGFGAIALYLAAQGARVTGIDPYGDRIAVGAAVASELGLPATFRRGWMEASPLPDGAFDLVVLNNSLCYVTDPSDRAEALGHAHRVARPGARLVMRDPSLTAPVDPFTGLPLVHQLPSAMSAPVLRLHRHGSRSHVSLQGPGAARRALRRAGFVDPRIHRERGARRFGRYQHLSARRAERPGRGGGETG